MSFCDEIPALPPLTLTAHLAGIAATAEGAAIILVVERRPAGEFSGAEALCSEENGRVRGEG